MKFYNASLMKNWAMIKMQELNHVIKKLSWIKKRLKNGFRFKQQLQCKLQDIEKSYNLSRYRVIDLETGEIME